MKRSSYFLSAFIILGLCSFSFTSPVFTKWTVDKTKSSVNFSVTHLMVSKATGVFKSFEGTMESSKPDFSDACISFTIDAASVDTDNKGRDHHLKADGYFDVEKYPKIKFESSSLKPLKGKNYKLTGRMTMKDVTKTVEFDVVKEDKATFTCTTIIDRTSFNITSGGAALGKDVTITVKAVMTETK